MREVGHTRRSSLVSFLYLFTVRESLTIIEILILREKITVVSTYSDCSTVYST